MRSRHPHGTQITAWASCGSCGSSVTPNQPGALPFVLPRVVEEGSIQAMYIKPAKIVPSPYGWGRSSAASTRRPQEAERAGVSLAAKVKGTGVRVGTGCWVQCWMQPARNGSGTWAGSITLIGTAPPKCSAWWIPSVLHHCPSAPLLALVWKVLWDGGHWERTGWHWLVV